jgi:hypothetical protein
VVILIAQADAVNLCYLGSWRAFRTPSTEGTTVYGIKPPDPTYVKIKRHLDAIAGILREASAEEIDAFEDSFSDNSVIGFAINAVRDYSKAVSGR